MDKNTIDTLKRLEFTEYEAKAYVSLVGYGMATAREIHEHSGVPQGRIYSVLQSLSDKNFIEVQEGNPSYYYAENPADMLNDLKSSMNRMIDEAVRYLSDLNLNSRPPSLIWTIHSEWGTKNRIKTLLQSADREVLIWVRDPSYFRWVLPEIKKLKKKINVEIYAKNKADFAGTNLRIFEFSQRMKDFEKEMSSVGANMPAPEGKIFMIVDDVTGFFIGDTEDGVVGTVMQMPQLTCMIKTVMKVLEEEDSRRYNSRDDA